MQTNSNPFLCLRNKPHKRGYRAEALLNQSQIQTHPTGLFLILIMPNVPSLGCPVTLSRSSPIQPYLPGLRPGHTTQTSTTFMASRGTWTLPDKRHKTGTSLVAQWLRIHLPVQGTWIRALVWEDPTCRGVTKPVSHNY